MIGIDVGHCETAASTVERKGDNNESVRLVMDGNNNVVIPSAITLSYDQMKKMQGKEITHSLLKTLGEIKIGNSAPRIPKDGEYFVYFKCSPGKFDSPCGGSKVAKETGLTHGKVMAAYIYQVFKNILRYNDVFEASHSADIHLLVGCPATEKWTSDKNCNSYAAMIKKATGAAYVRIIPESRAAMFSSIEKSRNRFSAVEGVMVFDFGSSTADYTYMLLGRKIDEYSWDLGASLIEQQMMLNAYEQCKKANGDETNNLQLMSMETTGMLTSLRKAKEEYYMGDENKTVCTFFDSKGKDFDITLRSNEQFMNDVTGLSEMECECDSKTMATGSWQALCKKFLLTAKKRLDLEKLPCKAIILTGGASRMHFIDTLCKEVFKDMKIFKDENPSFSVSNGLGWVAVADERYEACLSEAKEDLKCSNKGNFLSLEKAIQRRLRPYIFNQIKICSQDWADRSTDASANELSEQIQRKINSEKGKAEITKLVQEEINLWKENFKEEVERVVNKQAGKLFSQEVAQGLILSDEVWENLKGSNISFDIDIEKILMELNISGLLNRVIQQITYWVVAIAVAAALSFIPVVNVIIGMLTATVAQALVSDEDRDKKRSEKERKKINKEVDKIFKKDEVIQSIDMGISNAMEPCKKDFEEVVGQILKVAFDIITLRRFHI